MESSSAIYHRPVSWPPLSKLYYKRYLHCRAAVRYYLGPFQHMVAIQHMFAILINKKVASVQGKFSLGMKFLNLFKGTKHR